MSHSEASISISDQNPYGVEENVLPYPEECVFFVMGGEIERKETSITLLRTATATVVARRPDVAQEGFMDQARTTEEQAWEILTCYSLAEIRAATTPRPGEIIPLPEKGIAKLFSRATTWVIEERMEGGLQRSYVSAHLPKTVYEYLATAGRPNAAFFPIDQLSVAIAKLEAARDGDMSHAFYATDLQGNEIDQQIKKMWREASPEKRARINMRRQRYGHQPLEQTFAA